MWKSASEMNARVLAAVLLVIIALQKSAPASTTPAKMASNFEFVETGNKVAGMTG